MVRVASHHKESLTCARAHTHTCVRYPETTKNDRLTTTMCMFSVPEMLGTLTAPTTRILVYPVERDDIDPELRDTEITIKHCDRQVTVYSNSISRVSQNATADLRGVTMVLPFPLRDGSSVNDVTLIDMSLRPRFFENLDSMPWRPLARRAERPRGGGGGGGFSFGAPQASQTPPPPPPIERVGSYDVSVCADLAALQRVEDSHFKISEAVLRASTKFYGKDFGFIVARVAPEFINSNTVSTLAYMHPLNSDGSLFVPSYHVHDSKGDTLLDTRNTERFSHRVYSSRYMLDLDTRNAMGVPISFSRSCEILHGRATAEHRTLRVYIEQSGFSPNAPPLRRRRRRLTNAMEEEAAAACAYRVGDISDFLPPHRFDAFVHTIETSMRNADMVADVEFEDNEHGALYGSVTK